MKYNVLVSLEMPFPLKPAPTVTHGVLEFMFSFKRIFYIFCTRRSVNFGSFQEFLQCDIKINLLSEPLELLYCKALKSWSESEG